MAPVRDHGFTLVETLVAMAVLSTGLLALAGGLAFGARALLGSQHQLLASQRASEAVEGVFKARDSRTLSWAHIRNVAGDTGADNGVFLDGPHPMREPGPDGVINTADDGSVVAGTDGFTREVEIRDITTSLRRIRVRVWYPAAGGTREFELITFVSSYA